MAKYCNTSMEFFLKLGWREAMAYFQDVSQMVEEERESLESAAPRQTLPDTTGWPGPR